MERPPVDSTSLGSINHADLRAAADALLAGLVREPWGQVSPSVYETGRLVALAPWLVGHSQRQRFLVDSQRPDGAWGGPEGYALVPTLSATEALFATLRRRDAGMPTEAGGVGYRSLLYATKRGLRFLAEWSRRPGSSALPDTPAIEIIVSALVESINGYLDQLDDVPVTGLDEWRGSARLGVPESVDRAVLAAVRARLSAGLPVPEKLMHSLEVAGPVAVRVPGVRPVPPGTVGASPAATAAWLGDRVPIGDTGGALQHLEDVATRHGGPVPCGFPVGTFERAWVLSGLAAAGFTSAIPGRLTASLHGQLGTAGAAGGPGLPADADTTAVVLLALAACGVRRGPDLLRAYEQDRHFCTWPGESNPSVSTNAHVLEAYGAWCAAGHDVPSRYLTTVQRLGEWLRAQQGADGSWLDRWHASPYYATACCALALHGYDRVRSASAVAKAVDWVLATQRVDGSWGRWTGTVEETAYALQIVLVAGHVGDVHASTTVAAGYGYLRRSVDRNGEPALWHDKDLYRPAAIVRAAALGAMHLARRKRVVTEFA
jgi:hypothetical protein